MPICNPDGDPKLPATYNLPDAIYVRLEQRGRFTFVTGISREEYERDQKRALRVKCDHSRAAEGVSPGRYRCLDCGKML